MPASISGIIGAMLSKLAISGPVPSRFARTLMRTLSQASPSITSSPPRPRMMSLPSPPRMMLPVPNSVTWRDRRDRVQTRDRARLQTGDARNARGVERAGLGVERGDHVGIGFAAAQIVRELGARQAFHFGKAIEDGGGRGRDRRLVERRQLQVDRDADRVVLVGHPVEAGHAVHLVLGVAADEDVVAAFADHLVEATAADEDVVARHVVDQERVEIVAGRAVLRAQFDPVVAFVAGFRQIRLGAVDEVVALAAEDRRDVVPGDDEVLAVAAEDDVRHLEGQQRMAVENDVVAGAAVNDVGAAHVGDDVVAVAAEQVVVAEAALDAVVAAVAIDGVVSDAPAMRMSLPSVPPSTTVSSPV